MWNLVVGDSLRITPTLKAAMTEGGFDGAKLVVVDADYGLKKASWDQLPWGKEKFRKVLEVNMLILSCNDFDVRIFLEGCNTIFFLCTGFPGHSCQRWRDIASVPWCSFSVGGCYYRPGRTAASV